MASIRCDGHEVPAQPGRDVLGCLLDHNVPIVYLCMAGMCRTCRIGVLSGAEHLVPMTPAERHHFPQSRGEVRLACQAVMLGTGDVDISQRPPSPSS